MGRYEQNSSAIIMVVQCKKVNFFITGEMFLLDIGLLMGDSLLSD